MLNQHAHMLYKRPVSVHGLLKTTTASNIAPVLAEVRNLQKASLRLNVHKVEGLA